MLIVTLWLNIASRQPGQMTAVGIGTWAGGMLALVGHALAAAVGHLAAAVGHLAAAVGPMAGICHMARIGDMEMARHGDIGFEPTGGLD